MVLDWFSQCSFLYIQTEDRQSHTRSRRQQPPPRQNDPNYLVFSPDDDVSSDEEEQDSGGAGGGKHCFCIPFVMCHLVYYVLTSLYSKRILTGIA